MRRRLPAYLALMLLVGCQGVPEQDAIRPLRDNGPKLKYDELLLRARKQVDVRTAFGYAFGVRTADYLRLMLE